MPRRLLRSLESSGDVLGLLCHDHRLILGSDPSANKTGVRHASADSRPGLSVRAPHDINTHSASGRAQTFAASADL